MRQVSDLAHFSRFQQHFDDIEAKCNGGAANRAQIVECRTGQTSFLLCVHRCGGTRPLLGRTSLHFHENQAIAVSKHEIDFASSRSEVGGQKGQS